MSADGAGTGAGGTPFSTWYGSPGTAIYNKQASLKFYALMRELNSKWNPINFQDKQFLGVCIESCIQNTRHIAKPTKGILIKGTRP